MTRSALLAPVILFLALCGITAYFVILPAIAVADDTVLTGREAARNDSFRTLYFNDESEVIPIDGDSTQATRYLDFGGKDTYEIPANLASAVTIVDRQASGFVFPVGTQIDAVRFASDGVEFTINGQALKLLGFNADTGSRFFFVISNIIAEYDFEGFASLFSVQIPAAGATPVLGTPNCMIASDGTLDCDGMGGATGQLQVTLQPVAARTAGAQWRRSGTSNWLDSGETESDIPTGGQTVTFRSITGWTEPANAAISILAGETTTLTGTYQQLAPTLTATHPLNDTGIVKCAKDSIYITTCPYEDYPDQDAEFGRDALAAAGLLQKVGSGQAGFDFTKLDENGRDLPASAGTWSCVRDNQTGLIWENNSRYGTGKNYYWYNPDPNSNGGDAGDEGSSSESNTLKVINEINSQNLCGASDWRLPTVSELYSIISLGNSGSIDEDFFQGSSSFEYWTSESSAEDPSQAWCVDFYTSVRKAFTRGKGFSTVKVRLVRSQ